MVKSKKSIILMYIFAFLIIYTPHFFQNNYINYLYPTLLLIVVLFTYKKEQIKELFR